MSQVAGLAERKSPRLSTGKLGGGRTKQSMRDECNINLIMAKFARGVGVSHFAKHGLHYGDFPAIEYREAVAMVQKASSMFNELPAKVRGYFYNDPEKFLAFVQDPKNLDKMKELGLCKPEEVVKPMQVEVVKGLVADPSKPA